MTLKRMVPHPAALVGAVPPWATTAALDSIIHLLPLPYTTHWPPCTMNKSHIYVRDDQLHYKYDGKGPRRSSDDIIAILTDIYTVPPISIKQQRLGFLIFYQNDTDVNFIYNPDIQTKLEEANLTARLSYETENYRDIFILQTTANIYNEPDHKTILRLQHQKDLNILRLVKFRSEESKKKYIKITLDSKEARDEIVT